MFWHSTNLFWENTMQSLRPLVTTCTFEPSVFLKLYNIAHSKPAADHVIHTEPAFAEKFIAHLLGRTIRVEADLVDHLFN